MNSHRWTELRLLILSWFITRLVAFILKTLRYHCTGDSIEGGGVIAFLHGEQLPLLLHRPKCTSLITPISLSSDGNLQVRVMKYFGIHAVRGSTSRGALRVLKGLSRRLRSDADCTILIAVDGPRGPYGVISPGAYYLARRFNRPYWVCRVHCSHAIRLKTWDRFIIPLPFSRLDVHTVRCHPTLEATQQALKVHPSPSVKPHYPKS